MSLVAAVRAVEMVVVGSVVVVSALVVSGTRGKTWRLDEHCFTGIITKSKRCDEIEASTPTAASRSAPPHLPPA